MSKRQQPTDAERLAAIWSATLFAPGQVGDLRALGVPERYGRPSTWAGYFGPEHRVNMAELALQQTKEAKGVYFTLNPINPALLLRCCNKMKRAETGDLTKDKDVLSRRWLLIDTDPVRVAGVSATDVEKDHAKAVTQTVKAFLRGLGWPDPILVDSGNGFHLLYRIDLPAEDGGIVARILLALARRFDTNQAIIDTSVHNAARICKLPYTWARKGDDTPERPHRQARLLEVPPTGPIEGRPDDLAENWKVEVVPVELLNALAAEAPTAAPSVPQSRSRSSPHSANGVYAHRLLVDKWLDDREILHHVKPQPDDKGRTIYVLESCPFDPTHGRDSAIMQLPDGKMSAHCFHDGCIEHGWQDFKEKIGKPEAHHYDPPMGRSRSLGTESVEKTDDCRRQVEITNAEFRATNSVMEELLKDQSIYQRNGELVRVVVIIPEANGPRVSTVPRIEVIPCPALRDVISRWVDFQKTGEEEVKHCHPPRWCVSAVAARGNYSGFRHLVGVVSFPIMRRDGSILLEPGYDPATGLFLRWSGKPLSISEQPSRDDAVKAVEELLDLVADFPFQFPMHKAAWLAGLLTPFVRAAFDGPAPLFLVDANIRAAGKGLLLEVISQIVTGNPFPVVSYPAGSKDGEEELRKKITTILMYGDRLVLFDNLTGGFGDGTLDRCLTSTEWQDRQLGSNRQFRAPMIVTFYGTGNNVTIQADTARRICHIRLESPEERPEEREDFRQPNLIASVIEYRERYLAAALTILRAYHLAGRPDHALKPWGSFELWSRLVRNPIVWCGLPDPGDTRQIVQEDADEVGRGLRQLIRALEMIDPCRTGLTAAEIVNRAFFDPPIESPEIREMLAEAIGTLIGKPDVRRFGYRLRHLRRRVVDGRFIDLKGQDSGSNLWVVKSSQDFAARPNSCPSSPVCPSTTPAEKDMEDIKDMVSTGASEDTPEKGSAK